MRALWVRLGTVVIGVALASPALALSLKDRLPAVARDPRVGIEAGGAFDALANALADTAARTIPVISGSAGFTYRYNAALEVFERTSDTLGPLFLERPDTLGRGKLNINVSYQYVDLNEFDGDSMHSLEAPDPIVVRHTRAGGIVTFTGNRLPYDIELKNHVQALSVTYGILDNLDVNLLVPLIETVFRVSATNQRVTDEVTGGGPLTPLSPVPLPGQAATSSDTSVGIGDVLLRGKYQLPRYGNWRSAAGLLLRLPTGDEDDFQGTGAFEASPSLYISTLIGSRVEPHANFAVDLNADDVSSSQGRYGLGVDVDVTKRVGVALAFLGRSEFKRSSPPGETSFQHLVGGARVERPLLGIDFGRKDYFDLSFGARGVVWRQIMVFVNGIYALNDDGLRNDTIIPTVGFEGTF